MFKLTRSTSKALSNICADIAQIFFATWVVAVVVIPLDIGKALVVIFGLLLSIGFWILSLKFADKGKL